MTTFDVGPVMEDETLAERRHRVLMLRLAGATFTQIAERINADRIEVGLDPLSTTTYRKDHSAALKDATAASREDLVAEHRATLVAVRQAQWSPMINGDVDAARVVLSTLDREARLFGLDAPTQVALGVSDADFADRFVAAVAELGLEPPKEIADLRRRVADDAAAIAAPRPRRTATTVASERPDIVDAEVVEPLPFDLGAGLLEDEALSGPVRAWSNLGDQMYPGP